MENSFKGWDLEKVFEIKFDKSVLNIVWLFRFFSFLLIGFYSGSME